VRARLLAGGILALIYLYAFPYFCTLRSANELPRIFLTQEIVDHRTFAIDARLGEMGSQFDVSRTPDGRHFSNKAPGVSFLAVPIYALLRLAGGRPSLETATWAFRVGAVTLPCLLFLLLFFPFLGRFVPLEAESAPQRAAFAAYALGSMAFPYAILFFSHALAAASAGAAFIVAVRLCRDRPPLAGPLAVLVGFLATWSVVVDYQAFLAALAVAIYLVVRSRDRVRDLFLAATGAIPPAVLLLAYHQSCFGSFFRTGYSFAVDAAHKQGVLGIVGPNGRAFFDALLAPDNGLLVLSPWVLFAIVGGIAVASDPLARRRIGVETLVCAAVGVAYLLFIGSLVPEFGRAGWSVGPRYITVALPFLTCLAVPGLALADRYPLARVGALALVLVGVTVYGVAATTYPHWPTGMANPLYEVSFRALAEGMTPPSIGRLLGLGGTESLLPLYAVILGLSLALFAGRSEMRWVWNVAAAALAAAILLAYSRFPATAPVTAEAKWRNIQKTTDCGNPGP